MLANKYRIVGFLINIILLSYIVLSMADFEILLKSFAAISFIQIPFLFLILTSSILFITLRFIYISNFFQNRHTFRDAFKITCKGQFFSIFSNQIIGNIFGRTNFIESDQTNLKIASITLVEKFLTLTILTFFGIFAVAIFIQQTAQVNLSQYREQFIEFSYTIAAAGIFLIFKVLFLEKEARVILKKFNIFHALIFLKAFFASAITQCLIASIYMMLCWSFNPNIDLFFTACAVFLVMFCSAIPISINGWGVRELAAIYFFGHVGFEVEAALAISVFVGVYSSLSVIVLYNLCKILPFTSSQNSSDANFQALSVVNDSTTRVLLSFFSILMTTLIFFQFHLSFQFGTININLADPLAVVSLCIATLFFVSQKQFPRWEIQNLNIYLLTWTLIICFGFLVGSLALGFNEKTLISRAFGWLMLLGYMSFGILIANFSNFKEIIKVFKSLTHTAVLIVLLLLFINCFQTIFPAVLTEVYGFQGGAFEGFSANRNAFSFQLLLILSFLLSFNEDNYLQKSFFPIIFSLIASAIIITASIAALICLALIVIVAFWLKFIKPSALLMAGFLSAALLLFYYIIIPSFSIGEIIVSLPKYSNFSSSQQRWFSITEGLRLWMESPILGIGLGVFAEQIKEIQGSPLVIHSTWVWILVEFGLVGFVVSAFIGLNILKQKFLFNFENPKARFFLLSLVLFTTFALVHEIFYQRFFWFCIGLVLAVSISSASNSRVFKSN